MIKNGFIIKHSYVHDKKKKYVVKQINPEGAAYNGGQSDNLFMY
jgi:hypothetical protein